MAKYVWNASVFNGAPLYAATIATTVWVYNAAVDPPALVQIWDDIDGLDSKANPFTISAPGKIRFYANEGRYNIVVQNGGDSDTWEDELIGPTGSGGGGGGTVDSVVAGPGTNVDATDPANPVVSSDFSYGSTSSSYTLSESRNNQWLELTGSANIDITCPDINDVALGDDFVHVVSNYGTGAVTIVGAPGITVRAPPGGTLIVPQYATVGIRLSVAVANTYIVFGPTTAAS